MKLTFVLMFEERWGLAWNSKRIFVGMNILVWSHWLPLSSPCFCRKGQLLFLRSASAECFITRNQNRMAVCVNNNAALLLVSWDHVSRNIVGFWWSYHLCIYPLQMYFSFHLRRAQCDHHDLNWQNKKGFRLFQRHSCYNG